MVAEVALRDRGEHSKGQGRLGLDFKFDFVVFLDYYHNCNL